MKEYNKSEFNKHNKIVCKTCGCGFDSLPMHVLKMHGMTQVDYKTFYDLDPKEILCSPKLRKKRRRIALKHKTYRVNLLEKGQATRWQLGNQHTPVEKLKVINSVAQKKRWMQIRKSELLEFKKRINRYEDKKVLDALEEIKKPLDNDALITKVFNHLKERNVLKTSDAELMEIARRTVRDGV